MKLLTLSCQQCGAPLEVRAKARQFRCLYCGSAVHLYWADSAAQPKDPDDAGSRNFERIKSPELMRIETEIAQLDEAWIRTRTQFMLPGHDGQLIVPDKNKILTASTTGAVAGIAAIGAGVASLMEEQSFYLRDTPMSRLLMLLLGAGMMVVMVIWARIAYRRAVDFEVHQSQYQSERQRLLADLENASHAVSAHGHF